MPNIKTIIALALFLSNSFYASAWALNFSYHYDCKSDATNTTYKADVSDFSNGMSGYVGNVTVLSASGKKSKSIKPASVTMEYVFDPTEGSERRIVYYENGKDQLPSAFMSIYHNNKRTFFSFTPTSGKHDQGSCKLFVPQINL